MRSYHFDCGNSNTGQIGFCARVNAKNKREAVKALNDALPEEVGVEAESGSANVEYIRVYFGKVSTLDIDSSEPSEDDGRGEAVTMEIITVEVKGGNVQDVTNIPPGVAVQILDWDNIAVGDKKPKKEEYHYGGEPIPESDSMSAAAFAIDVIGQLIIQNDDVLRPKLIKKAKKAIVLLGRTF